jgi:chemotaxis protein histidine kinase CheA
MELNNKVKELEDELKVLKAEIRNVLLDIREVILEKHNPLAEEHESAFIRMDLNTTARAMAAEAAGREAAKAVDEAESKADDEKADKEKADEEEPKEEKPKDEEKPKGKGLRKGKGSKESEKTEPETPVVAPLDPAEIPLMFRAPAAAPTPALGLATWVVDAMKALGPHQLDRVIAIHRLCGNLPPNVSEALTHLQELIRTSEGEEPPWLDALQELDKIASP